jgi:hypothetical protein
MSIGKVLDLFGAIVGVALAWVIVSSKQTAAIIKAFGSAFTGGLKAATGQR